MKFDKTLIRNLLVLISIFFLQYKIHSQITVQAEENLISIINGASPNSVINVADGIFHGGIITNSNTIIINGSELTFFDSEITINANNITINKFKWNKTEGTALIDIRGKNNVIKNCDFSYFGVDETSKAIWIRNDTDFENGDYSGNIIENCDFSNWGGIGSNSCIKVSDTSPVFNFLGTIIKNNTFKDGPFDDYSDSNKNSTAIQLFCPTLVENNIIEDSYDGIEVKGSNNIIRNNNISFCSGAEAMSNRSGSNNIFEGNTIHDIQSQGIQIWSGENNIFRNNIVYNCERIAHIKGEKQTNGIVTDSKADKVYIYNNTFYNNDRGITWDPGNTSPLNPPLNIEIVNNIFYGDGSDSAIENSYYNTSVSKCSNNLYYNYSSGYSPQGNNFVTTNPSFVGTNNFVLQSNSPCIDVALSTSIVTNDIEGNHRPLHGNNSNIRYYDIGAYEYFSTINECELIDLSIENVTLSSDKSGYRNIAIGNNVNITNADITASNKIIINPNTTINSQFTADIAEQCTSYVINLNASKIQSSEKLLDIEKHGRDNNKIKIYPNPNAGIFYLDFNEKNQSTNIEIFDSVGRLVFKTRQISNATIKVNINDYPSNLYFVKISFGGKSYIKKVLIQK